MRKAVYPGTFDPFSNGHLDIVKRASRLFDELHILIAVNLNKKNSFTPLERLEMIVEVTKEFKNVKVEIYEGLVVNYCKQNKIMAIIRGLRNFNDYENEYTLYQYNKDINPEVETILLLPAVENQFISSSAIKELIKYECDISKYIPQVLCAKVKERLSENKKST